MVTMYEEYSLSFIVLVVKEKGMRRSWGLIIVFAPKRGLSRGFTVGLTTL